MFKKQSPLTLEQIDGKLLSQDRWIFFLIILGMTAILVFLWELDKIDNISTEKYSLPDVSYHTEFIPQKNQERKLLVLFTITNA